MRMRTRFRKRLTQYEVHCPTCGAAVQHGGPVPAGRNEDIRTTRRPVPPDTIPSWVIDLEVDEWLEAQI